MLFLVLKNSSQILFNQRNKIQLFKKFDVDYFHIFVVLIT